jgi:hypothetical protein
LRCAESQGDSVRLPDAHKNRRIRRYAPGNPPDPHSGESGGCTASGNDAPMLAGEVRVSGERSRRREVLVPLRSTGGREDCV